MSYGFLFLAAYNINKIASTNERKILENHIMDLALNAADEFAVPLMNDEEIINFSMNYAAKICNDITDIQ